MLGRLMSKNQNKKIKQKIFFHIIKLYYIELFAKKTVYHTKLGLFKNKNQQNQQILKKALTQL